jgi:hypothetical protein
MVAGFCVWRRKPNGANGAHPNASAPALREPNGANGGTPYTFLEALRGGCGFTAFVAELASRLQVKRRRVLPRCLSKESKKVRPGRGLCPYPGRGVNGSTGERAITGSN